LPGKLGSSKIRSGIGHLNSLDAGIVTYGKDKKIKKHAIFLAEFVKPSL
jgi:hypothetical protein